MSRDLFVSTNYWERYYTLVPSAVALGMAIVPLWASMGNYITRMSQKYYEYSHYKEQDEQGPQQRPPRGSHAPYLLVFQAIFYSFFHLSFACAQLPMIYFLNNYLYDLNHTLINVQSCGQSRGGVGPRKLASLFTLSHPANTRPAPSVFRAACLEVRSGWCPVHKLPPQRRLLEESLPAPTPHLHCGLAAV